MPHHAEHARVRDDGERGGRDELPAHERSVQIRFVPSLSHGLDVPLQPLELAESLLLLDRRVEHRLFRATLEVVPDLFDPVAELVRSNRVLKAGFARAGHRPRATILVRPLPADHAMAFEPARTAAREARSDENAPTNAAPVRHEKGCLLEIVRAKGAFGDLRVRARFRHGFRVRSQEDSLRIAAPACRGRGAHRRRVGKLYGSPRQRTPHPLAFGAVSAASAHPCRLRPRLRTVWRGS